MIGRRGESSSRGRMSYGLIVKYKSAWPPVKSLGKFIFEATNVPQGIMVVLRFVLHLPKGFNCVFIMLTVLFHYQ